MSACTSLGLPALESGDDATSMPACAFAYLTRVCTDDTSLLAVLNDVMLAGDAASLHHAIDAGVPFHADRARARARFEAVLPILEHGAAVRDQGGEVCARWLAQAAVLSAEDLTALLRLALGRNQINTIAWLARAGADPQSLTVAPGERRPQYNACPLFPALERRLPDAFDLLLSALVAGNGAPLTAFPVGRGSLPGDSPVWDVVLNLVEASCAKDGAVAIGELGRFVELLFPRMDATALDRELARLALRLDAVRGRAGDIRYNGTPYRVIWPADAMCMVNLANAVAHGAPPSPQQERARWFWLSDLHIDMDGQAPEPFLRWVMTNNRCGNAGARFIADRISTGAFDVEHQVGGLTLLQMACRSNNLEVARALLERGADPRVTLEEKRQVLDCVALCRQNKQNDALVTLLQAAMARRAITQVVRGAAAAPGPD